jgi:photosystem II stability/assembly factor-like uncharacterized protein
LLGLSSSSAHGHDASAWGGLFRSRDHGATWFVASPGWFVGGAVAVAISPVDSDHLLLASESGLLRSRNGGRDWSLENPSVFAGAVLAAAFDADGQRALAATASRIVRTDGATPWRDTPAQGRAAPAHVIVRGAVPGRVYVAGPRGLSRSHDWGASWERLADGLPDGGVTALAVSPRLPEVVYAVVGGQLWVKSEEERWVRPASGISGSQVDALSLDSREAMRIWAAGAGRVFRSDDRGTRWSPVGPPLPVPNTIVRGIAADGDSVALTTDRGLYRTSDGGRRWTLLSDNLPAHLEAGPLVSDPFDPTTLYAGFSLKPYSELWRRTADDDSALGRLSPASRAAGTAFLIILGLAAAAALRRLAYHYKTEHSR